jgi:hypothetical protein
VFKIDCGTYGHDDNSSHNYQKTFHRLSLLFWSDKDTYSEDQYCEACNYQDNSGRYFFVGKEQRGTQGSQEIFDQVKKQIGYFFTLIEVFIYHERNDKTLQGGSQPNFA